MCHNRSLCVVRKQSIHLLELHKSRILSFQESLSRQDCCKCPLHTSLKRKRSGPSHKYPFSSVNLVFILHQAVSKAVKVHYVSQNWAEAAVFMRNIDTFGCIVETPVSLHKTPQVQIAMQEPNYGFLWIRRKGYLRKPPSNHLSLLPWL